MTTRVRVIAILTALLALALGAGSASAATVVLKFYDVAGTGTEVTGAAVRTVMRGSSGGDDSDALLDPATLQDVYEWPLYRSGSPGRWRFDIPSGRSVAFSVNWPTTSNGYSNVIVDNGGSGFSAAATVVFNYQAALDAKRRLDAALRARSTYVQSRAFTTAYASAASNITSANAATTDADRGRYGQLALDAVDVAYGLLLEEYGPAYAVANRTGPWIGLTVDDLTIERDWARLASTTTTPYGWTRIVFDPNLDRGSPSYYDAAVRAAQAAGLKVLAEPIDSTFASGYTRAQYLARIRAFVDYFPTVEAWEIGNEVNGCWVDQTVDASGSCTGTNIPAADRIVNKLADAASYVRTTRPSAKVVVTLYWQLGTDAARWSVFNWVRAGGLPSTTRANVDTILLSTYVEDAPLGLAFDQVMTALQTEFPGKQIGLGELDYWAPDTSQFWWAYDSSSTATARQELAHHYYAASLGYAGSIGGGFWWYFVEEFPGDALLQRAVRSVVDLL